MSVSKRFLLSPAMSKGFNKKGKNITSLRWILHTGGHTICQVSEIIQKKCKNQCLKDIQRAF